MPNKKDSKLTKAGVSGYNKPKRTPSHPTKSHVVVAKEGDETKTIRFGQQGERIMPKVGGKQYSYDKAGMAAAKKAAVKLKKKKTKK